MEESIFVVHHFKEVPKDHFSCGGTALALFFRNFLLGLLYFLRRIASSKLIHQMTLRDFFAFVVEDYDVCLHLL